MADTTFTTDVTVIEADWLNDVNDKVYGLKSFGVIADGVTNDTVKMLEAIAYVKANGGMLEANSDDVIFLGTFADSGDDSRFLIDFDDFVFNTNNCKFTANASASLTQGGSNQSIFKIQDASNVTIGDFHVVADSIDRVNSIGIMAVSLRSEAAANENITIGNITGTKLLAVLHSNTSQSTLFRYRHVHCGRLYNNAGYYNVNFANNVDDFKAIISSDDVIRSYFVYGCQGHEVKIYSQDHPSFTDVLIKRYERDTKNINVIYDCINDLSADASVSIEHQNDTDNGIIEDINIRLNVEKSSTANPTLNFVSFTDAGATRATTESRTNNIRITGTTNSAIATTINSIIDGDNVSRLKLDRLLMVGLVDYKKYIVLDGDTSTRMAVSDETGTMNLQFNVSEFTTIPNWGLLTVWGADNPNSSSAEYIHQRMWVLFTVASDGSCVVSDTQIIDTFTAGALAPTITFPANGVGSFKMSAVVNNFTHANRLCRAKLEVFGLREY